MEQWAEFRNQLVDYIKKEHEYCEEDIRLNSMLSDEEKVDKGLLFASARIVEILSNGYVFESEENNTKLRPGDNVRIIDLSCGKKFESRILDCDLTSLTVETDESLNLSSLFNIEVAEFALQKAFSKVLSAIDDGSPGTYFLKVLSGQIQPDLEGFGGVRFSSVAKKDLNENQILASEKILKKPSVFCIQGPPGTGKTKVLSSIAFSFSTAGKNVLILSNTHQAINNALNGVACYYGVAVAKVGNELKSQELHENILRFPFFWQCARYISERAKKKAKCQTGVVVGMTLHSASFNLGIKNSLFQPSIVLVDEASQIPLVQAAVIGTFGSGSVVFIGDDKQMPPIFHEKLEKDPLSQSIFSFLIHKYPKIEERLNVTYRMNDDITRFISSNFYEIDGESISSSDVSKHRRLTTDGVYSQPLIERLLTSKMSIDLACASISDSCEDENFEEAQFVSQLAIECLEKQEAKDFHIAIVTPFRRQVRMIRSCMAKFDNHSEIMVDTVERLQGQDVDVIIVSLCTSSEKYFEKMQNFILNPNRMNVMLSRAKLKALIVGPRIVLNDMLYKYRF